MKLRNSLPVFGLLCLLLGTASVAPDRPIAAPGLAGAWKLTDAQGATTALIISNGYFSFGTYAGNKFIGVGGGTYATNGNSLTEKIEYDTQDKNRVGQSYTFTYKLNGNTLQVSDGDGQAEVWTRIDEANRQQSPLAGTWRIRGRMSPEGEMSTMQQGPRKTIKILSGTRFQWAAINTETKEFFGAGGGTYTAKDGKYTENIEFFSRDSSRVGASLTFDFEVKGNDWHHSGKSSTGNPINEVWARED